jgi:hypothetical protein
LIADAIVNVWGGKEWGGKLWSKDLLRELEPERSVCVIAYVRDPAKMRRVSVLGFWFLSPVFVRRSADSLPNCESSWRYSGAVGGWVGVKAIISHEELTETLMEHPTHGLGESIGRIDDPCDVD